MEMWKSRNEPVAREEYLRARNKYVEVRRKAQKEYEGRIVENCESNPKMFHKFINGKLSKKEVIEKVKVGEDNMWRHEKYCGNTKWQLK